MTTDDLIEFVREELDGTLVVVASESNGAPEVAWGDTFLIYDPEGITPPERHFPYATVVINDYPGFDESSQLSREGVFRVNMWVSRATFAREAPDDGEAIDYAALDKLIPHPVYGKQSWLSVLNPDTTADKVKALLVEAHNLARSRYDKKSQ